MRAKRKPSAPASEAIYLDSAARSLQGILSRRDSQHAYIVHVRKDRNDAAGKVAPIRRKLQRRSEGDYSSSTLKGNPLALASRADDHRSQQAP